VSSTLPGFAFASVTGNDLEDGTALVLKNFGKVIACGGAGVVIASQSGARLGDMPPATSIR